MEECELLGSLSITICLKHGHLHDLLEDPCTHPPPPPTSHFTCMRVLNIAVSCRLNEFSKPNDFSASNI